MNVKVYNQLGKEAGTVDLPDTIFGLKWNADLVHQVVTSQESNKRRPIAHVKGRSEVRGGGRKPWRQKGTGRARHGSIRSPLWKGGGVTHGPTKERNFKKKINKKMARLALWTVLSAKARDKEVIVIDDIKFSEPKTKLAYEVFKKFSAIGDYRDIIFKKNRVLVALPEGAGDTKRALRNLSFADITEWRNMNALDLLRHKYLLLYKKNVESGFK